MCGHRDKRDARHFLFGACQAQAVERDLRQPGPELPAAGNKQAGNAVGAQGILKILRLAEHGRAATGHFFSLGRQPPSAKRLSKAPTFGEEGEWRLSNFGKRKDD
jgi:hypothetical protein